MTAQPAPITPEASGDVPLTIAEAGEAIRSGRWSSQRLTEALIHRADVLDEKLGTFLSRYRDSAVEDAVRADDELRRGLDRGPLHGIPVAIKDNIVTRDGPTTAQSRVVTHDDAARIDAPVCGRLRDAGAVLTGKTSLMEFAIGSPYDGEPFPLPRNPWNPDHYAGGSSSGSANGVAAGLFLGAVGSDTGGSIRSPSSWSGVVGMKPSFGLVPTGGCIPLAFSLDHVGPMARTAWDAAALLGAMAGTDPERYIAGLDGELNGVRVGVVTDLVDNPSTDPDVAARLHDAVDVLERGGAVVESVSLPLYDELRAATLMTMCAEGAAYHHATLRTHWEEYAPSTRMAFATGFLTTAADYVQIQRVRHAGSRAVATMFDSFDVVAMPTTSRPAPVLEGLVWDTIIDALCTPYWNAVGAPALSVPVGFTSGGLPVGLQLAAGFGRDATLLGVTHALQQRTDHHRTRPRLIEEETS